MGILELFSIGLLFCVLLMVLCWLASVRLNFYSIVDAVWSLGIGATVILLAFFAPGSLEKKFFAVLMASLWSLRLGSHLLLRLLAHYPHEDRRYADLKKTWSAFKFLVFFLIQGLSQILFCVPFLFILSNPNVSFTTLEILGAVVFLIGFVGEFVADRQLHKFRSQVHSRSQVCDVGLWRYSRHPNYFFEWLTWCGVALVAMSVDYGFFGLLSPVLMYLTLNYFTGIPILEEQALASKGEAYRDYQRKTNRFFPGAAK